jgi:hypothetical protein
LSCHVMHCSGPYMCTPRGVLLPPKTLRLEACINYLTLEIVDGRTVQGTFLRLCRTVLSCCPVLKARTSQTIREQTRCFFALCAHTSSCCAVSCRDHWFPRCHYDTTNSLRRPPVQCKHPLPSLLVQTCMAFTRKRRKD